MRPADPDRVLADLERRLGPRGGSLDHEAVEALDVVQHALAHARPPGALIAWRAALRTGSLSGDARAAVRVMVADLNTAITAGHPERVSAVCDCLGVLFDEDSPAGTGG